MERATDSEAKFEAVTFEIATGVKIRVQIDEFWELPAETKGHPAMLYFAIRVYSDEETNPLRMVRHTDFRAGNDFDQSCIPRLTAWLSDLTTSRHRFSYDRVEDFIEEFSARMEEFAVIGDDAADYIYKTHGLAPAYEDPPHVDFPEDKFQSIEQNPNLITFQEWDTDDPSEDEYVGPRDAIDNRAHAIEIDDEPVIPPEEEREPSGSCIDPAD